MPQPAKPSEHTRQSFTASDVPRLAEPFGTSVRCHMSRPAIAVTWAGLIGSQAIKVPTDLYMLVLSLVR